MPYTFSSPAYNFPSKWTTDQRATAMFTMKQGIKTGASETYIQKQFVKMGLKWRKTDALTGIRRAFATEASKSRPAYNRAQTWFSALEKIRAQMPRHTGKEALEFMKVWKFESLESEEELRLAKELEMEGFCPSPPCEETKEQRRKRIAGK